MAAETTQRRSAISLGSCIGGIPVVRNVELEFVELRENQVDSDRMSFSTLDASLIWSFLIIFHLPSSGLHISPFLCIMLDGALFLLPIASHWARQRSPIHGLPDVYAFCGGALWTSAAAYGRGGKFLHNIRLELIFCLQMMLTVLICVDSKRKTTSMSLDTHSQPRSWEEKLEASPFGLSAGEFFTTVKILLCKSMVAWLSNTLYLHLLIVSFAVCGPTESLSGDLKVALAGPMTHIPMAIIWWGIYLGVSRGKDGLWPTWPIYLDVLSERFAGWVVASRGDVWEGWQFHSHAFDSMLLSH